jgi:SNF2 family DNA or RNA helicase
VKTYGKLEITAQGFWWVEATPDVMIRLKRIFPRAEGIRAGGIILKKTPEMALELEWVRDRWPLRMEESEAMLLTSEATEYRRREEKIQQVIAGTTLGGEGLLELARPAREYQQIAADLAYTTRSLLLADDLGLGKSMSGLLVLRDRGLLPALIVCPTHLPHQWAEELRKTLPMLRSHILSSGKPYIIAEKREMKGKNPHVIITNYHKIAGWVDHLAGNVRCVIFDEVQELRRAESQKYVACARIADGADVKVGLTATPVYNYAGEIHNILSVLAPDQLGSRGEFAREWGRGYWSDKLAVHDSAALGHYLRNRGLMLRRTRAQVGRELPELTKVVHQVESNPDTYKRLMDGTLDLAHTILEGERKEAFKAAGQLDWKVRRATGVAKAPYVAEFTKLVLESEERVVLFGWHRDCYAIYLQRLHRERPVLYTGSESPAAKRRAVERFLKPVKDFDGARVLIMSLRAGAGLDGLQEACSVAIFGELDWSPGMHDQCAGRLHRDGQNDPTFAYYLVSNTGSDPVISDVLGVKRMQSEPLRDPDAEILETQDTSDRVKELARLVLEQREGC